MSEYCKKSTELKGWIAMDTVDVVIIATQAEFYR